MFDREEYRLGGAANVAHNIAAMGEHASLFVLIGKGDAASQPKLALRGCGLADEGLVANSRPTSRKVRVVTARNQQVARIDYEHDGDAAGDALDRLRQRAGDAI